MPAAPVHAPRRARLRTAALALTVTAALAGLPLAASAETPGPSPSGPPSPSASPSPPVAPSASPSPPVAPSAPSSPAGAPPGPRPSLRASASPTPSTGPAPERAPGPAPQADEAAELALTLRVRPSTGSRFYQDVGSFVFTGTVTGLPDGSPVEVYRRTGDRWTRVARTSVADGAYRATAPVQAHGRATFVATTGRAPGADEQVASTPVTVTVADARLVLRQPAKRDTLKNPTLRGYVVPARAGVVVTVDVLRGGTWRYTAKGRTDGEGEYAIGFAHGKGRIASYTVRANYKAANRSRWERTGRRTVSRTAVLDAVVTKTTAAEVAKTYRRGCPVGPSKLRTVTMNHYGRDQKVHRGVVVIRSDLTGELIAGFGDALRARYPVDKLRNPNAYGGNDPKQMKANNTSGFNCRKVVGNPYAQSPHSYGTAIDVNPVQNPYRDRNGTWWPSNGKGYIDRSPVRWGMLTKGSTLTRSLRGDGFFWGGLWSPGRDYQHFQY